ncbi:MAG: TRAP transporter small permease [Thalassospira sp.]|uniref:TRAP transporter small permease n=1 Tax=Thalassospira sp. TaxID=1912094 RepID=UPI003A843314
MRGIALGVRRLTETLITVLMIAMVGLTFCDVIGRHLFGYPIYGANDLIEHLMALVVFAGLPLVTVAGMHLTVDIFDKYLLQSGFYWWRVVTAVGVSAILALIAYLFVGHAQNASSISEVSQALNIPRAPFYFYIAISCGLSVFAAYAVLFATFRRDETSEQDPENELC